MFKRSWFSFVIIVMLCVFVLILSNTAPCFAWKAKTHAYLANLTIDEINKNGGYVEIPPFGKLKVSQEYYTAIKNYPEYFRGGAVGPDAIPDIYTGQSSTHPEKSYLWLQQVLTKAAAVTDPTEKQKAMAFAMGYAAH